MEEVIIKRHIPTCINDATFQNPGLSIQVRKVCSLFWFVCTSQRTFNGQAYDVP